TAGAATGAWNGSRRALGRVWSAVRQARWTILGVVAAVAVVVGLNRVGFVDDYGNTLQVMGFDPDRATLLTSLLVGAIGAAVVGLVGGRYAIAVATGAATVLVGFYPVFRQETGAALAASGPDGTFDSA